MTHISKARKTLDVLVCAFEWKASTARLRYFVAPFFFLLQVVTEYRSGLNPASFNRSTLFISFIYIYLISHGPKQMSAGKGWAAAQLTDELPNVPYLLCIYLHLHLTHHFSLSHLGSGCFGQVTPSQIKRLHVQTFLAREARSFAAGKTTKKKKQKQTCGHGFGRRTQDLGWPSCPLQSEPSHLFPFSELWLVLWI